MRCSVAGSNGIEPMELRHAAQLQIGYLRQAQLPGRQRPAAGAVEAPIGQALAGILDPGVERGLEGGPAVPHAVIGEARRGTTIEHIDPGREEGLAARRSPAIGRRRAWPATICCWALRRAYRRAVPLRPASRRRAPRARQRNKSAYARYWLFPLTPPCRRRSARPCAASAGRLRPARSGHPCRKCRCRHRASDHCRSC